MKKSRSAHGVAPGEVSAEFSNRSSDFLSLYLLDLCFFFSHLNFCPSPFTHWWHTFWKCYTPLPIRFAPEQKDTMWCSRKTQRQFGTTCPEGGLWLINRWLYYSQQTVIQQDTLQRGTEEGVCVGVYIHILGWSVISVYKQLHSMHTSK